MELSLTSTCSITIMSVKTLHFTSNVTIELIRSTLHKRFPRTDFEISIEVPRPPFNLT